MQKSGMPGRSAFAVFCTVTVMGPECCRADDETIWQDKVVTARSLLSEGQHAEAAKILSSVLRDAEQLKLSAAQRAIILGDLGGLYLELGRHPEAESNLRRSLGMRDRAPQVPASLWLQVLNDLAEVYTETGELGRAQKLAERTLNTEPEALNLFPVQRARALHNLATVYYLRRRYDEAKTLLQDAVRLIDEHTSGDSTAKMYTLNTLARVLLRNEPEQAMSTIERARRTGETILGPQHPGLVRVLITEAAVCRSTGRLARAEASIQEALAILQGNYRPLMLAALEEYAVLLRQTGRGREAKAIKRQARQIREEIERDSAAGHKVDITTLTAVDPS